MNMCASVTEEREHGEGAGAHATLLSDTLYSIGLASILDSAKKITPACCLGQYLDHSEFVEASGLCCCLDSTPLGPFVGVQSGLPVSLG